MNQPVDNLVELYKNDPVVRERLNDKGLFLNFTENSTALTFYLTKEVKDSVEYHEFVEIAMALTNDDSITVLIDSPGGYLSGANLIITALNSTEARSTAVVIDMAASAATIIALACDDLIMTEHSYFMIHAVSFGSGGKLHEVASHTEFTIKKSKELISSVYADFLSEDEILQVIAGRDFYFDADETMERWARVLEIRAEKLSELELESIKEQIEHLKGHVKTLEDRLPKPAPTVKKKVVKE